MCRQDPAPTRGREQPSGPHEGKQQDRKSGPGEKYSRHDIEVLSYGRRDALRLVESQLCQGFIAVEVSAGVAVGRKDQEIEERPGASPAP